MGNTQRTRNSVNNVVSVKPPRQFLTKDEFFDTWYIWKRNFLTFKKSLSKDSYPKEWGDTLLNIMGPVGLDIYNTFIFSSPNERNNVDILLQKFDEYFLFLERKKLPKESVYGYIDDLKKIIKEKNIEDGENQIKHKILIEIDKSQFNNSINCFIPSFKLSDDFNKLTLKEIGFIWTLYTNSAKNCMNCGNGNHAFNKCPSQGKQCSKCNDWNHFSRRCPKIFVTDCNYCGGVHMLKQCPAFNEICTKCGRLNHFSWRCRSIRILHCRFCSFSHAASRAVCPANNTVCAICKTTGHFTSMCNSKAQLHSQN